jgi:plasmid maintenance system antidote protein VapI
MTALEFDHQWFSPPGATIAQKLHVDNFPLRDFAWEMSLTDVETQRLLEGRLDITDAVATRLEQTLGVPASFWIRREAQYRKDVRRLAEAVPADVRREWLRQIPVKDMIDYGWIAAADDPIDRTAECFRYFDIGSVDCWQQRIDHLATGAKLRTSTTLKSTPGALAAWLRRGEIEAETVACEPWDQNAFIGALKEARKLTRVKDPAVFIPRLRALCAGAGVALVIARVPAGCRASGATRFLAADKALMMLSFRFLTDDHFWFTFFHEAGHLLLHGKEAVFLEGESHDTPEHEEEANTFAQNELIPPDRRAEMLAMPLNRQSIMRFAAQVGISPGIVLGQLQHAGLVKHNFLSFLKRRYHWV